MTRTEKRLLITAAFLICVSLLCSLFFIAGHSGHDCTHTDDCAICRLIDAALSTLRGAAEGFFAVCVFLAAVTALIGVCCRREVYFCPRTLISLKTELRN